MSGRTIFEGIWRDVEGDLSKLTHHRRYHQDSTHATPATEAPDMSFVQTIEDEIHNLADHARKVEQEVLPAAVAGAKKLEAFAENPAVQAIMAAEHVPVEALVKVVVGAINGLEELYKPETAVAAPSEPVAPVAAPAEPVAAPVA